MGQDDRSEKFKQVQSVLGSEATIQRETIRGPLQAEMNRRLREIGALSNPVEGSAVKYKGTLAVHIYMAEELGHPFFQCQLLIQDCNDILCSMAVQELVGTAMEKKGHKRPVKRSGW